MKTLAFVRALLARWDRRVVAPQPPGRIFLRPVRPPRHARGRALFAGGDVHVHLRPQLSLTLVHPARTTAATTVHTRERTVGVPPVERLVLRATSVLHAERVLERVTARGVRVDAHGAAIPPIAGTVAAPPAALPRRTSELVVRRADSALAADVGGAPIAPERQGAAAEAAAAHEARAAARAVAAIDVGRLTDQVVAAIDRRLLTQAERLGRA